MYRIVKAKKSSRHISSLWEIAAFLLGVAVNDNIFAIFSLGSTYFYLGQIISVFLFACLFVKERTLISFAAKKVPNDFKLFFAICCFSSVVGLFFTHSLGTYLYRTIANLILLLINLSTLIVVISLGNHYRFIVFGIFTGFLINTLFSAFAYVMFSSGIPFSLRTISIRKYDFIDRYQSFRAQGLFLEPSHYVRYAILSLFVFFGFKLNGKTKWSIFDVLFLFGGIFVLLLTQSGSLAIFAFGLAVFLVLFFFGGSVSPKAKRLVACLLIVSSLLLLLIFTVLPDIRISDSIDVVARGADITNEENSPRLNGMKYGVTLIFANPFGYGWGDTGTLYEGTGLVSPFSFVLAIIIETGVVGGLVYFIAMVRLSFGLFRSRNMWARSLFVAMLCLLALQIGTDYAFDSFVMIILGFAISTNCHKGACVIENENSQCILGRRKSVLL